MLLAMLCLLLLVVYSVSWSSRTVARTDRLVHGAPRLGGSARPEAAGTAEAEARLTHALFCSAAGALRGILRCSSDAEHVEPSTSGAQCTSKRRHFGHRPAHEPAELRRQMAGKTSDSYSLLDFA